MPTIRLTGDRKVILIDGKPSCDCCCTGAPVIQWDSRSASKTKCGYSENAGFVSTPPKIYHSDTWDGTQSDTVYVSTTDCTGPFLTQQLRVYSGTGTYSSDCECEGDTKQVEITNYGEDPFILYYSCDVRQGTDDDAVSGTERVISQDTCDPALSGARRLIIDITDTLSDEYTTSELLTNTEAALPSFPGTWTGTAGSYFNLTTDELTNSIRESKYRFSFTIPSGSCYRIDWIEDGTPKTWQYTGGGTPGDIGYSDEYTIPIPSINRTATVTDVTFSCDTCT